MTSPDVTPYVDLTVHDTNAQLIFETALEDLQVSMSDWVPNEGDTAVVLMEALALEVDFLVFAINRIPGAVTEVLLRLFGLEPDPGVAATADVTFTVADTTGYTIPVGTRVRLTLPGLDPIDFLTNVNADVPVGAQEVTVAATAEVVGQAAHGATAGLILEVVDALTFVEWAELAAAPAGGVEPETGAAFLDRGKQLFMRLSETLVTPDQFVRYALEKSHVYRAFALDLYDPAVGPAPGDNPGHTTVAVAGTNGAVLTAQEKTDLETEMDAVAYGAVIVHVVDPNFTAIDVTASVVRLPGYADADVQADVAAALTDYLDPDAWAWSATVYVNEIIALIDRVPGVDRVTSVTLGANGGAQAASNVALSGVAPLATAGAFVVNVATP